MRNNQTKDKMKNTLLTKLIFIVLLVLIVMTIVFKKQTSMTLKEAASKNTYIEFPDRKQLPLVMLDQANTDGFSSSKIKGKWHILYFGYTFCPDICPVELTVLHKMREILRKEITEPNLPQIIFISIDPERDTPDQVKKYVSAFDKNFIGLTGENKTLQTLASPFGIAWTKDAIPTTSDSNKDTFYTMSHSTTLLLINPDSKVTGMFPAPHTAKDMALIYKTIITKEKAR